MSSHRRRRETGFTLIELMVVTVVVALLLAIAVPSYNEYVLRGHRANAQAALTDIAGRQQQFLLDSRAYASTLEELRFAVDADVATRYAFGIAVGAAAPPGFTVTATPKGSQAADKCGAMSIDQAARREPPGCW
jgi:type IV pilus assembly protein PilE